MRTTTLYRSALAWSRPLIVAAAPVLGLWGCGAAQKPASPPVVAPTWLLMGPLEAEAARTLTEMADIVEAQSEAPEQAVSRLDAYLRSHRGPMRANTAALVGRFAALDDRARRQYERELSDYLAPAHGRWRGLLEAFGKKHPVLGRRLAELVARADK